MIHRPAEINFIEEFEREPVCTGRHQSFNKFQDPGIDFSHIGVFSHRESSSSPNSDPVYLRIHQALQPL